VTQRTKIYWDSDSNDYECKTEGYQAPEGDGPSIFQQEKNETWRAQVVPEAQHSLDVGPSGQDMPDYSIVR